MGMVPKSTKSETRILNALSFQKVIGFVVVLMLSTSIAPKLFGNKLGILFTVFACVVYIICMIKSPTDPKKLFIIGLKEWLKFKYLAKDIYGESSQEYKDYKEEVDRLALIKEDKKQRKAEKRKAKKA